MSVSRRNTALACDVAIIGAGTAGLAAERAARAAGASTLLIDEGFAGTTCTTVGCMPSKLLIAAGNAAYAAREARHFGVHAAPEVDGAAVLRRLRGVRDQFVEGVKAEIATLPKAVCIRAHARFVAAGRLQLDDGREIVAKAVVVATGSTPSIPDVLSGVSAAVLTNETLFDLETLPRSVGVIGAGPLGLELAQALARLGVGIAVFDVGERIAGLEPGDVMASLRGALVDEFPIHCGVKLEAGWEGKAVTLRWTGASRGTATFDYVLAATGRPPRFDALGLAATGLALDDHGAPKIDPATLQAGDLPIFFAGDAAADRPVLHEAQAEGAIAGRNAACFPRIAEAPRMTRLAIMFTDPGMATVGEMPDGIKTVSGFASYADQGRAKVFLTNRGCVRIDADAKDGRLLAAEMVGPAVEHSAHLLALAIGQGLTADALLAMPFYHPTYEEGLQPALRAICEASGVNMRGRAGFMPGA